jgi:DNA-directed RNA polymerase subunit RPC12/RpoP
MHVIDAGQADGAPLLAYFRCVRCSYEPGWMEIASITEGRRGLPCPTCNPVTLKGLTDE